MSEVSQEIVVLSKLSLTTMETTGKLIFGAKPGEDHVKLAHIFGYASGIKPVLNKTTGDTHLAITGQFEGVNLQTGKIYRSGILYLPSGIHDAIAAAAQGLQEDTDFVEFGLEIRAVKSTSPAGYAYQGVSLSQAKAVDPLEEMRNRILDRSRLISSPVPAALATQPTPEATTEVKSEAKKLAAK